MSSVGTQAMLLLVAGLESGDPPAQQLRTSPTGDLDKVAGLVALCHLCALSQHVLQIWSFRKTDQLFVSFHCGILGRPLSKSQLFHRVVEAIQQAYASSDADLGSLDTVTPTFTTHRDLFFFCNML